MTVVEVLRAARAKIERPDVRRLRSNDGDVVSGDIEVTPRLRIGFTATIAAGHIERLVLDRAERWTQTSDDDGEWAEVWDSERRDLASDAEVVRAVEQHAAGVIADAEAGEHARRMV